MTTNKTLQQDQIKHFTFLKELEQRENNLLPDQLVIRMKKEYEVTAVMVNPQPFRQHDHCLAIVYLKYCYSHPIYCYMTHGAFDHLQN